jgi:hypothetical protein
MLPTAHSFLVSIGFGPFFVPREPIGVLRRHFSSVISLAALLLIRHKTGWNFGVADVQPAWLQFVEIFVASDFPGYVFHRALHSYAWLWRFHQVHHSSEKMDWLANARLHPVDKLLGDGAGDRNRVAPGRRRAGMPSVRSRYRWLHPPVVQFTPLLVLGFASGLRSNIRGIETVTTTTGRF